MAFLGQNRYHISYLIYTVKRKINEKLSEGHCSKRKLHSVTQFWDLSQFSDTESSDWWGGWILQRTLGNIMSGVYCNDSPELSPRGSMNIYLGAHTLWDGHRHFQGCLTQGLNWHCYLETWSIITSLLEGGEHKARCSVESRLKSSLEQVHEVFGPTQLSFTQFPNVKCRIKILSCWNNTNWILGLWSKSY